MSLQDTTDAKVLLVDDLQENLTALQALVRAPGRTVLCATSGEEALALMLDHDFAVAILDVQMPGMDGFELAELMRGTERTRHIPIVFVSAAGRELNYAFRGYDTGAVDFLHKPLEPQMVRSKVSVFVDLFRQRQRLLHMQADLERAVRMRDDFLSMVSHELRNPLNTLYLQAQLRSRMAEAGKLPDVAGFAQMAGRDQQQIQSMIRLLDDMLDATRVRTGKLTVKLEPMDLAHVARHTVDSMQEPARAAGTPLALQAPDTLPLFGDAQRLQQVLTNLLTNAVRYGEAKPVQVRLWTEGEHAVLAVRDQGPGISPPEQERIFEQFERGDAAGQVAGLGLGLFISRQIVQAHGGRIELRSTPGQGAEFRVRLPLPR
ncbi:hybrid sensor histidine kinase/response regulator [Ramlibacter algicola]|uniref:histidine kinase n=1 Tax=Ramlibacter algicola TaxID=2795217 RepID=A0A934PX94_9BURK|nr:hybrid sensor histidine kinase/response regulator [Ramlibacter algicola]MBK0392195.1 hybrid sensor histidine kinase/response regulator [Ramlibacter algicola]